MNKRTTLLLGIGLASVLGYLAYSRTAATGTVGAAAADTFKVSRGPLRVTITEAAELYAAKSVDLRSGVEGRSAILWLVEEGKYVKKGDKVAELDVSDLEDRADNQEIAVSRARAAEITADKNFEIQKNQNASDIEAAELNVLFAQLELEKFMGRGGTDTQVGRIGTNGNGSLHGGQDKAQGSGIQGEREQRLVAAKADIELAQSELKTAEFRLEWTEKLYANEYVSETELQTDQLKRQRALNQLQLARNKLEILEKYELPKTRMELEARVREANAELERTKLWCEAKLASQRADLESKRQQLDLEEAKLAKYREQIKAGTLYAPSDGLVVYAVTGDRRRREPIDLGTEVREGQAIISLPDVTTMKVKTSVHEAHVDKVSDALARARDEGLPRPKVTMKIDALPDRVFFGRVTRVAVVPDSNRSWFNPEVKLYTTHIELEGDRSGLRPGQSASVEIEVAQLEDVLTVPVQAVHREGRVLYVWKHTDGAAVAVPVETGIASDQLVVVEKGLAEGDVVFLSEPEGVGRPEFAELNERIEAELKQNEAEVRAASISEASSRRPGAAAKEAPGRSSFDGERPPYGRRDRGPRGDAAGPGRRGDGAGPARDEGGGRRGRGDPAQRARSNEFWAAAKERFPEHADELDDRRGRFRNGALMKKVLEDPQLKEKFSDVVTRYQQLLERFQSGEFGGGRGGFGRERGPRERGERDRGGSRRDG